jgi:hypothetical protein
LDDVKLLAGSRAHGAEFLTAFDYLRCVIPEIDIWRAANLMLKRYGDKALDESAARADELAAQDDRNGAAVWRRITDAIGQHYHQYATGLCARLQPVFRVVRKPRTLTHQHSAIRCRGLGKRTSGATMGRRV